MEIFDVICSNRDKELIKAVAVAIKKASGGKAEVIVVKMPVSELVNYEIFALAGDSVAAEVYNKGMRCVKGKEIIDQALKNE